ncbi:hypothetical protein I6N95_09545 [Vagococcus sp. BWB3-3]|uniref:Uncharacterized protein n=1 Tax=Vagococcus allomyrinae TaxID=2794353 RepID=A0A940SUW7_9ENTE|nr:hypothetical protein [Vagococcus allomyrinae]MBP1041249.1 hypothetical protein [Vagococcus allomyrinae]
MADIVQLVENGQKKYIKTHVQAVEGIGTKGELLWSGGLLMEEGQTVTPKKKLSECANGWLLKYGRYNAAGIQKNWYGSVFIPKEVGLGLRADWLPHAGATSTYSVKLIEVSDSVLKGHNNNTNPTPSNAAYNMMLFEVWSI